MCGRNLGMGKRSFGRGFSMNNKFLEQSKAILRRRGYKLTGPRLAILDYMAREKGHPDVQGIYGGLRSSCPGIGMATVYRTVDLLVYLGILRALVLKNSQIRYEPNRPGDHHHHLVCKGCGDISEFGSCNFKSIADEIEEVTRFEIEEHTLEVYGYCPDCLAG